MESQWFHAFFRFVITSAINAVRKLAYTHILPLALSKTTQFKLFLIIRHKKAIKYTLYALFVA